MTSPVSPLLQEAAKVLAGIIFPGSKWEHLGLIAQDQCLKGALVFTRWLLTREPTKQMVEAGFDAQPIPPMRAQKQHYVAAYRAMNAALLKEMG